MTTATTRELITVPAVGGETLGSLPSSLRISAVIPTLNEAKNLRVLLPLLPDWLDEVIIADGCSTDGTAEVARQLCPKARIVVEPQKGKGAALRSAFAAAAGDIIVTLDADGSMHPREIVLLVGALLAGADYAKGSRFLQGGGTDDMSTFRMLGNWGLTQTVRLLYGGSFSDLCYGYFAFWSRHAPVLKPNCDGFEVESLLTVKALKAGLKIFEVPSFEAPRLHGESHLRAIPDGWRVLKTILRERFAGRQAGKPAGSDRVAQGERADDKPPGADASRPLRILMVTPRCFPEMGGIETHVHEVGKRLVERGHKVRVLATDRSGQLPTEEMVAGMAVKRVAAWPRRGDYYFAPTILGEIMTGDWDVVHIQGYHTLVAPLGMMAAIGRKLPFVITFHSGGHSSPLRKALRQPQWLALGPLVRRASHWIGVSRFEADFFSGKMRLPRQSMSIIRNGAEMPRPAMAPAPRGEGRLIVSIGRLERYKGHHRVIEAFPQLLERCPDARLRILGEGPYKASLIALAERLKLGDRVEIGGIPPAERGRLATILGSAALVVLLSEFEAHPVAVMEALALGRPVLATNGSGFVEMIEQGLIRAVPMDADSSRIAAAIAEELGRDHPPSTVDLPTWDDCADQLETVYRIVVQAPR